MAEERRYTLAEAKLELAKQECDLHGHSFNTIVVVGSGDPVAISCDRCGTVWRVDSA